MSEERELDITALPPPPDGLNDLLEGIAREVARVDENMGTLAEHYQSGGVDPTKEGGLPKPTARSLLGGTLFDLVKAAPRNPSAWTMIQNKAGKPVPNELVTAEEVFAWVEANIKPTLPEPTAPTLGNTVAVPPILTIPVFRDGREWGHCDYSCALHETSSVPVSRREFMDMAAEANDIDELMDSLENHAMEDMNDNGPEDSENSNYDYAEYQCSDSEADDSGIRNRNRVLQQVNEALQSIANSIDDEDERNEFLEKFDL